MIQKLSVKDLTFTNKKVLVRVDFNVPLDQEGQIADDARILAALTTIQYIIHAGGACILISHLGRPKGKDPSLSLAPCAQHLSKLLHQNVRFISDCIGTEVETACAQLNPGDVILLENLRFYEAEKHPEKDPSFAEKLAKLADIYVNDAFATAHRDHSSTTKITKFFPDKAACGFLMGKEIELLNPLVTNPQRPFYAVIGGAKVSTKIGVLISLIDKVDALFIGGAMAYTFLAAKGIAIGDSYAEKEMIEQAQDIQEKLCKKNIPLFLPEDVVCTDSLDATASIQTVPTSSGIPPGMRGVDIGEKTIQTWSAEFAKAQTIFWNGPVGIFEDERFAKGTYALAHTLAQLEHTITIIGGGDSALAIHQTGCAPKMTYISTGGGASLEYIETGTLPAIEALSPGIGIA